MSEIKTDNSAVIAELERRNAEFERVISDMDQEDIDFMQEHDCGAGMLLAMRDKAIAELQLQVEELQGARSAELDGYAGVKMWIGDREVTKTAPKFVINREMESGMTIQFLAQSCLNQLAGKPESENPQAEPEPLGFHHALKLTNSVIDAYCEDNPKWHWKIADTPIPNDLAVRMAKVFAGFYTTPESQEDAT